jgi:hypothetical protein
MERCHARDRGAGTWAGWDHRPYLRVAWSLLRQGSFPEAIPHIRRAVPAPVAHATLELFWARLVDAAIASDGAGADFQDFLAAHPDLEDAGRVLAHYSPERIGSERARREFVLPDRAPLPAPTRRGERSVGRTAGDGTKTIRRA